MMKEIPVFYSLREDPRAMPVMVGFNAADHASVLLPASRLVTLTLILALIGYNPRS